MENSISENEIRTPDEAVGDDWLRGTDADAALDQIAGLAASICDASVGVVGLTDGYRTGVGVPDLRSPDIEAVLSVAAASADEIVVVQNYRVDATFGFYAVARIAGDDSTFFGTLCVADPAPRMLSAHQREALRTLAAAVVAQIELSVARRERDAIKVLVPVCAWCQATRDENGNWVRAGELVVERTPITHGICPACAASMSARLGRVATG